MALIPVDFATLDTSALAAHAGRVVVFADASLTAEAQRIDRKTRGALTRALASPAWEAVKPGEALTLAFPFGMAASAVVLVRLPRRATPDLARKAGASIAKGLTESGAVIAARGIKPLAELVEGLALRAYGWTMKTEEIKAPGPVTVAVPDPKAARSACADVLSRAEAVHFTRDLVNEPANILTTTDFAARLEAMRDLGLEVEVLDEAALETLGMRALLAVGQGSESPSRVVVLQWKGAEGAPLALVG
ncbi:MAG: leucyl aminopeptidase, partial [Pararhodobacter sp.]|nr:leucyl aminopeptidase [Pararhodobacter sp.]